MFATSQTREAGSSLRVLMEDPSGSVQYIGRARSRTTCTTLLMKY